MITLLARIFIREDDKPEKVRLAYGTLCGIVGILLNVLLFTGKFIAGTISKSIAITADAFNNLSDAGSSIVTLLGFKLGAAKPDPEHPFGHGRMEYVSGLVVAAVILIMAVELIQDSIRKILHPEATECSALIIVILLISIAVKLYMTFYNRRVAKKINSAAMRATAMDSLSDSITTSVVLITTLIAEFTSVNIDGYCGVAVGLYFLLKPHLGTETVSWVCILGAAPFAALGFVKYNGMTAEKFIWAWIKSEFLMPKKLVFHSTNTYLELMKPSIEKKTKEAYKNND